MKNKIKKIFDKLKIKIDIFYGGFLSLLFFMMIVSIFAFSYLKIYSSDTFSLSDNLLMATAVIATSVAIVSMVFSYASNLDKNDKNEVIIIGENLILSSVGFILNLVFMGMAKLGYIDELFVWVPVKFCFIVLFIISVLIILLVSILYFVHSIYKLIIFIFKRKKGSS